MATAATATGPSGEIHSDEEWERIKGLFVTLYKVQGKSLNDVRATLSKYYGFHATNRQYKFRILKWGIVKKGQGRRDEPAKAGEPRHSTARATPPQPPLSLAHTLRSPAQLETTQTALIGVSRFFSGVLHADVDQSLIRAQSKDWSIRQFYDIALALPVLAAESQWKQVQRLYGELLDSAASLLNERNPILLICLLQTCCRFLDEGQGAVLQRFLGFVERMAVARGLRSHPLRLLATAWGRSGEHAMDLLVLCSREAVDILEKELGPDHPQTLSAHRALHTALTCQGDHATALKAFLPIAEKEIVLYPHSFMTFAAQARILHSHLFLNNTEAAAVCLERMEEESRSWESHGWPEARISALRSNLRSQRGELLRLQRDPRAIAALEEAVENAIMGDELRDYWAALQAQRHLRLAKSTEKAEGPVEPFKFFV
ncbi:hypothetical protein GQ53DRAFT_849389 [Thozetella sp. PMI_491]|nr:hypothetical protein GQ53DRAFT_849389 [Thozetella sp. PMI_491]